jgi:prephenate dehydrogenase
MKKKNELINELTAGSFKSMTRVAVASADMWTPIFEMNSNNISKHLKSFIKTLQFFERNLRNKSKLKKEIVNSQK